MFRGGRFEPPNRRIDFDPVAEGKKHGLDPEVSKQLWARVRQELVRPGGRIDEREAQDRFHELAKRVAARGGLLGPGPAKVTLLEASAPGHGAEPDVLAKPVPGRTTQVLVDERRWERRMYGSEEPPVDVEARSVHAEPPDKTEVDVLLEQMGAGALRAVALAAAEHAVEVSMATPHTALADPQAEQTRPPPWAVFGGGSPNVAEGPELASASNAARGRDAARRAAAEAVTRATSAPTPALPRPAQSTLLTPSVGHRMSRLFGVDLTHVKVVENSALATGSTKAVTKDGEVHFRAGAYLPGTREGDRLIAHELAHVVQQQGRGERDGTRNQLEREADRAATFAARGQAASIRLRAQPTAAYAFNEGEHHDHEPDETDARSEQGDAAKGHDGSASDTAPADHGAKTDDHGKSDQAPKSAPPDAVEEAAPGNDSADARVDAVAAVIPAEETAAPIATGGGAPAKPQKEPPSVATTPEVALGQLQGVRPDKLGPLFEQMHTATRVEIAKARAAQQATPPKQMSTGATAAPKDAQAKDAAPAAAGDPKTATDPKAAKDGAAHPIKADVPGAAAAKQAQQREVAAQREAVTQVVAATKRSIDSWFGSWSSKSETPREDASAVKMSEKETRELVSSVDNVPTTASDVSTDTGPAPELAMKSEAKGSADKDRVELEKTAAALETLNRADSQAPMGEDHIESTVAAEELTAALPPAAPAGPAATLPTVAGAATSEEVGIVAQEQQGAEIDAALTQASTDVTAKRGEEAQADEHARAEADNQVRALKTQADADQATARSAAQAEVQQARGQWQAEISQKGADARMQADKKVAEGMSQVEAEEAKANAEAKQHVEEGKRKADEKKQKGEKEAADAKTKGKSKSSGFWGWVSSKAKAVASGIKKAVTAAIDACRRAVKAVIAAAKKLAMAVIEIARKVIVGLIKAIGQALIAISGVLLAAFPALKAKFQNAIRKSVDKAVSAVNKLAEGLKKAVQKALDWLGGALDKALQLLEKGIHFVIDAASAVVQGAIKAAQALVEMLGTWAKLIKDVATGPGSWIGKLAKAVVDGIKNHLWSALKTTVIEWFKSKVFELLGVGGIVLQILLDGGMSKDDIIQMALDALIVAIPAALVAILVEKLVSMIVPAAGALMAIIEGLQAAWGTISRIIAAFAAFMAFLLAVKSGGAGPMFATVLAGAAVVVLDFVANWLLKKLASAARRVGAKLKGLAEKFKSKRKAKKDARSPKGHHDDHDHDSHNAKQPKHHDDGHDPKPDKDKEHHNKADQALVARVAREAASVGWRRAKAASAARVQSRADLESSIRGGARAPTGVRVDADVVVAGSSWRVKSTATKGAHRAAASTGDGAALKAKSGATWYTSKNMHPLHQQILRDTAHALKRPGSSKPKDLQTVYDAKKALAHELQAKGQSKIDSHVQGIKFDITMEPFAGVQDDHQIKTRLLISPNYEELELNVPATGDDTFKELAERLQREVMSKNPYHNQDVILAGCDKVATALGVKWNTFPKGGGEGKELVLKFTANDAAGKEKTYVCQIVQTHADDRCASCDQHKGVSEPHNVVSQGLWKKAVNAALDAIGLDSDPVSPLQAHITGFMQRSSATFGEAQKQCAHCESPGLKAGPSYPGDGASLSLVQRGALPNADTDPSIVGKQFGGTAATSADLEAITAAHVKKVLGSVPRELMTVAKMFAGDRVAAICDPTKERDVFVSTVATTVRSLAR